MTIKVRAHGYADPVLTGDRWTVGQPTSTYTGEFGDFRIEVGATWDVTTDPPTKTAVGYDITTVRGALTLIRSLQFAEPYGEIHGLLELPKVTAFDTYDTVDALATIDFLVPGATIDIWRVLPAAEATSYGASEAPYWHGLISDRSLTEGAGLTRGRVLMLDGALFGEASTRYHQPVMQDISTDIGTSIARDIDPLSYSRPLPGYRFAFESATTGIETRHRGSRGQHVIDYLDEMLALAQDSSGQWTISRAFDVDGYPQARKYYLRLKAAYMGDGVQENTIVAGGFGVELPGLDDDASTHPNVIYGEGVAPDGERWRNAFFPALSPTDPGYPSRTVGTTYPLTTGDADADFDDQSITQLQYALRMGGWPDVNVTGTFDADTVTALNALYEDAGEAQDGEVASDADWDLVFSTGTGTTDLLSGYFRPLAIGDPRVEPFTYAANGAKVGDNDTGPDAYDQNVQRVEEMVSFDQVPKKRARINSRRRVNTQVETTGTIRLKTDVVDESEAPLVGRSRLLLREGGWIQATGLAGGTYQQFYMASIQHAPDGEPGMPTEIAAATRAYDLLDLSARIEREHGAETSLAKSFKSERSRTTSSFKSAVGWNRELSGNIAPTSLSTGWNVIPFVAGQQGTIQEIVATTYASATKFALACFGAEITSSEVAALVSNPLAEDTSDYGWWNQPSIQDDLDTYGFIEALGAYGQACGYSTGRESASHSVTGKLIDSLGWRYLSLDPPYLWLAVYVPSTCSFKCLFRTAVDE